VTLILELGKQVRFAVPRPSEAGIAKVSEVGIKHLLTKPYPAGTLLKTMRAIGDEA
jgi:hypothetical protein